MVFSSLVFLYLFLPGTLLVYGAVPGKAKNAVLLAASLAFYFWGEQAKILVMLLEIALAYSAGLLLSRLKGTGKKTVLGIFLTISLALLCCFKYTGRFALPIGISFYTFQCMSYAVDVYRGDHPAEKDPLAFALYVSFFPQLIAGPIVRYSTVSAALKNRQFTLTRLGEGAFRFTLGLGKKVLIADKLFAFMSSPGTGAALAWAQAAACVLYVYFDFSGYSDMAIGLARAFGFDLPENFNYPLISRSVREFWRRWHSSLGSWFRDYVYIPLGGSRRGLPVKLRNLLIVWTLTGIWHGASVNFAVWGLFFGILLSLETLLERLRAEARCGFLRGLRVPLVLIFTILGFTFFRFTGFDAAFAQFGQMFSGPFLTADGLYLLRGAAVILAAAVVGATPLPKNLAWRLMATRCGRAVGPAAMALWMFAILMLSTASLVNGSFSPFLYFRF